MCDRLPYVLEIAYQNPLTIFQKVVTYSWAIFFDSAQISQTIGRYSYIAIDPFIKIVCKNGVTRINNIVCEGNYFFNLKKLLKQYEMPNIPHLPPFQGGLAGYFAYDLCHELEKLPTRVDEMEFPDMMAGLYDMIIAFDHLEQKAWLISNGFSKEGLQPQDDFARKRADWLMLILKIIDAPPPDLSSSVAPAEITRNFTRSAYEGAVQKTIDYIHAGDIFQANITQCFTAPFASEKSAFQLYCRLRKINPAPFAAFLNFDEVTLASASPERFIKLIGNHIETRPIKGTRPRLQEASADLHMQHELLNSEKDFAENVMIVDLMRNDLSKVCLDHSVKVIKLCALETFATVHHLVSVIHARLQPCYDSIDLLQAVFPGGSVTGAPKIRAMEIIAELEPTRRGPYCGSIGYIGFNGNLDTSIVIRSFTLKNNVIQFQTGGGIVADSQPAAEYAESLLKAQALMHALTTEDNL